MRSYKHNAHLQPRSLPQGIHRVQRRAGTRRRSRAPLRAATVIYLPRMQGEEAVESKAEEACDFADANSETEDPLVLQVGGYKWVEKRCMNSTILAAVLCKSLLHPSRVPDSYPESSLRLSRRNTPPRGHASFYSKDVGPKPLVVVLLASDQPIPPESISSSNSPLATTMLA